MDIELNGYDVSLTGSTNYRFCVWGPEDSLEYMMYCIYDRDDCFSTCDDDLESLSVESSDDDDTCDSEWLPLDSSDDDDSESLSLRSSDDSDSLSLSSSDDSDSLSQDSSDDSESLSLDSSDDSREVCPIDAYNVN